MDHMKALSERKPAAAQPLPVMKTATVAMPQRSQTGKSGVARFPRPKLPSTQNAQRNYERYLELARAETLRGDQIAARTFCSMPSIICDQCASTRISFQALSSSELDPPIVR